MSWKDRYKKRKKRSLVLMKDELGEKIMKQIVGLRAKTYSYLIDDSSEYEKAIDIKTCVHKKKT